MGGGGCVVDPFEGTRPLFITCPKCHNSVELQGSRVSIGGGGGGGGGEGGGGGGGGGESSKGGYLLLHEHEYYIIASWLGV